MPRKSRLASLSIHDLAAEIQQRVSTELPMLKRQREQLDRQISELEALATGVSARGTAQAAIERAVRRKGRRARGKPLREYVREVLAGSGTGMSLKDLEAAVRAAGYPTRAKSLSTPIFAVVSKDAGIQRVSRGVYRLKRKPAASKGAKPKAATK
jgi:hypothetical protein